MPSSVFRCFKCISVFTLTGLNNGLFSDNRHYRDFYRLYYPLCVSRRIDTWHIV